MENFPVSITDIAVIGLVLISGLLALARGFVREVLSIVAWILAAVGVLTLLPRVREPVRAYFKDTLDVKETIIADVSAGAVIFIVILVILSLAAAFISRRVQSSDIGTLDRSLGFLFGLLRGAFIVCLAYLMLIQFIPPKDHPKWIKEAKTLPALEYGSTMLVQVSPKFISGGLETAQTWDEKLMRTLKDAGKVVGGMKDDISKAAGGYKKEDRKLLDRLFGGSDKDKDEGKDKGESKN